MDKIVIEGPTRLKGTVEVSGAKNSALPIMAATLLTDERCVIRRVPPLRDVNTMIKILRNLGVKVQVEPGRLVMEPRGPCRRQPIAVELLVDGRPRGQVAEALVTLGEPAW